jgi:hypothetical protein
MRFTATLLLMLCCGLSRAGDAPFWDSPAGMRQELDGQNLELRDELIPAQLAFLEALALAAAEAESMDAAAPEHPLAWARVEYLLETAFRLL